MIIEEQDEILRTMSGQLTSISVRAGIQLENLFPKQYPPEVYAEFPIAKPGEMGWGRRFQSYIDDVYEKNSNIVKNLDS